jgi:hypothetical protein
MLGDFGNKRATRSNGRTVMVRRAPDAASWSDRRLVSACLPSPNNSNRFALIPLGEWIVSAVNGLPVSPHWAALS